MNLKDLFWDVYIRIRHFKAIKEFKGSIGDFPKLIEVVMSCNTEEHCDAAFQYLQLYFEESLSDGLDKDNVFGLVNHEILMCVLQYLQDTRYHAGHNFHKVNNTTVTVWPDINDYLNKFLTFKFAKSWTRGKSSILSIGN